MAKIVMVYRNLADAGTVSADDAVSTMPAANVQEARVSKKWRAAVDDTALQLDFGAATDIDCVAILGLNLTAAATARVKFSTINSTGDASVYDSGLLDPAGVDSFYGSFFHLAAQSYSARYVRVELTDAALDYIEAGRLVVGLAWRPEHNFEVGYARYSLDSSSVVEAESGEEWVNVKAARRAVRLQMAAVSQAEIDAHLDPMIAYAGRSRQVLVCLDPAASNLGRETFFGRMQAAPSATSFTSALYKQSIEIAESR